MSHAIPNSRGTGSGNPLLERPILPTLVALAFPNVMALGVQSLAAIAETKYIGLIGTSALASMAIVFPTIMLTQMMSSGAMGGGVSSAVSRALGAGDHARARSLALHALAIGLSVGLLVSALFYYAGPSLYEVLGGRGEVLDGAVRYARTFFAGAVAIWLFNSLLSIVRGTGNMRLPSIIVVSVGLAQIVLGACLALGLAGVPRLELVGVAAAQIAVNVLGGVFLIWYLTRGPSRLRLEAKGVSFKWDMFRDILKVGAIACLSPIQSILVVLILARFAANYGTEALAGFGIGLRLELLLVPIAFAIGVACVPMVGMAIGAGQIERARKVAWTGGLLSAILIGGVGLLASIEPSLWGSIFTDSPEVLAVVQRYLSVAGIGFPAYGLGLSLYFASQGSGKIIGPVLAGTVRLAVVIAGGYWLFSGPSEFRDLAVLVAVAMVAYGLASAMAMKMTRWGKN